jgi:hypothetical protein
MGALLQEAVDGTEFPLTKPDLPIVVETRLARKELFPFETKRVTKQPPDL